MRLAVATPTVWDSYLTSRPTGHFLQSWAWGEFQEKLGNKIWRLVVEDNSDIVAELLVIKLSLGFGQSILYSPRGQLIDKTQPLTTAQASAILLLEEIKKIGKEEKALFFRIDPPATVADITTERFYTSQKFTRNRKNIQPRYSSILDLSVSPEQLLNRMKSKTRYNIHLAERHEITTTKSTSPEDFRQFLQLTKETSSRQGFSPHSNNYYQSQYDALHPVGMQELWLARRGSETLAAILVDYFGNTATYVHGASDNRYRELMAPYLLQFAAIKDAHERGFKHYDFWGINPNPKHPWAGFTRFKRGFGGEEIEYLGTFELPFNSYVYKLYRLLSR
jgi:lipid II:glycine glycyltransferase (peptidoglycan interpeptide bridge formation enzyme)